MLADAVGRYAGDYRIIVLAFSNTLCSASHLPDGLEPVALVLPVSYTHLDVYKRQDPLGESTGYQPEI